MPLYVYTGQGNSISVAGRTLSRGHPTMLEGRAAEQAEGHAQILRVDVGSGDAPTGLGRYAALKARAKELGIPATGKAEELEEAITVEEAAIAEEQARLTDEAAATGSQDAD